jgi:isopenicillin N synthase-like dioxygenase
MNSIPSVNLKDFLSSDLSKKTRFVKSIGDAFHSIGFVALSGHFLNNKLVNENI